MSKDELWAAYAARNPQFDNEEFVTLSTAGLKKLFDQTWSIANDSGYRRGLREATEAAKQAQPGATRPSGFDFFEQMFGGGRR